MTGRKRKKIAWVGAMLGVGLLVGLAGFEASATAGMKKGNPRLESIGALTFSPEGILFLADSASARIVAIDRSEEPAGRRATPMDVRDVDVKIAALLGTTAREIVIHDLAVNPQSSIAYLSVSRGRGNDEKPVLLTVDKRGRMAEIALDDVSYSEVSIADAPAKDAQDQRGRPLRTNTVTDLVYADDEVLVAGLSNEEFASTFRKFKYPFDGEHEATTLEIYHVAHQAYETNAPIRTFTPIELNDEAHILAAYTCTPLVAFPVDSLSDGAHVKGRTVAELGAGNRPMDIITYGRGGRDFVLIANNNRTVMKVSAEEIAKTEGLTRPMNEDNVTRTAGAVYRSMPFVGVLHLENLSSRHIVMLQRDVMTGGLNLRSIMKNRL